MKRTIVALFSLLILISCSQSPQKKESVVDEKSAELSYSVDDLIKNAPELADKKVVVKGTVMHVCQHGGARCFLMGSSEDYTIRVEAGEKIGAFSQEHMGSELEIMGILREVKTEADAHQPGHDESQGNGEGGMHMNGKHEHDSVVEEAHAIIPENEQTEDRVFYLEGLEIRK